MVTLFVGTTSSRNFQAYIRQVLAGLCALHAQDILHRGISPTCVYLANSTQAGQPKVVKLAKSGYFTRLLDLYRSNKFGGHFNLDDSKVPEGWWVFAAVGRRVSAHSLKVTEGSCRLAPAILKVEGCAQCWHIVLADARWLRRDGIVPKPKACIANTSVFLFGRPRTCD